MKPKFKDFALPITGRRYQILYDPNCLDVTYDELKVFIMRLKQEHRYEDVAVLVERYDYLLKKQHQRTKKFNDIILYMIKNGEKIKNIEQVSHSTAPFLTETERSVLEGTYQDPTYAVIQHVAYSLRCRHMESELEQLLEKYKDIIIEGNTRLLEKYHSSSLPETYYKDMQDINITQSKIDGISPMLWKALNDPNYVPQLAHLKPLIKELKKDGKTDLATILEDKYEDILFKKLPEPSLSSDEAKQLLGNLLSPNYHSIFETIENSGNSLFTVVDEDGVIHFVDSDGVIIEEEI